MEPGRETTPEAAYGFGINWLGLIYVVVAFVLVAWSDVLGLAAWAVGAPLVYVLGRKDEATANGDEVSP